MLKKQFTLLEAFKKLHEDVDNVPDSKENNEGNISKTKGKEYIQLLADIKAAEEELSDLKYKFKKEKPSYYSNPSEKVLAFASEEELKKLNELSDEINKLKADINEIEKSYQHQQEYRTWHQVGPDDWDDDWEIETIIDDEDKKKELEPKVNDLKHNVINLRNEVNSLITKFTDAYNNYIDTERSKVDFQIKQTNLDNKKNYKKELLNAAIEEEGFSDLINDIKSSYPNMKVTNFKYDDQNRPVLSVEISKHFDESDLEDENFDDDGSFYGESFAEDECESMLEDLYFDDDKFDLEVIEVYNDDEPTIYRKFYKGDYWTPDEWDIEIDGDFNVVVEMDFTKLK